MSMERQEIENDAALYLFSEEVGKLLKKRKETLSTAESCTGGNIAAILTAIPGSSDYFKGGIVAYSNEIKTTLLQVRQETLARHGAVSEETVREMAKGSMKSLNTDFSIATSGIAGPGGGSPEKPVGTVWIAVGFREKIITFKQKGDSGRSANTHNATRNALRVLYELLLELEK